MRLLKRSVLLTNYKLIIKSRKSNLTFILDNTKIKIEPGHEENSLTNPVVMIEKPNILKKKTHVITTQTSIEEESPEIKKTQELLDERIVSREGDVYTCLICINNNEIVAGEAKAIISHMKEVGLHYLMFKTESFKFSIENKMKTIFCAAS